MYATDSASMLSNTLKLITVAERDQKDKEQGTEVMGGNPFGKPWGLQVDGDLWEQAWRALKKRGSGNQSLRKVKGHATAEDAEKGISTSKDREGNDTSDKLADRGVEAIGGIGLVSWVNGVKLGKRNTENSLSGSRK